MGTVSPPRSIIRSSTASRLRWAIGNARFAPYIGIGYSFAVPNTDDSSTSAGSDSIGGYTLIGGLRYVLSQGDHTAIAAVAESGLRYYAGASSTSTDSSGVLVPLMLTLQVVYK